jgi:hypothetical protein
MFEQALERAHVSAMSGQLTIDARALTFLDHLLSLAACAARSGATAVVRTRSMMPARLVQMLKIEGIRIEQLS